MSCTVKVYIYDLSRGFARPLAPFLGMNLEAIWHTGIVVFGKEYSFGPSGIVICSPGDSTTAPVKEVKILGNTSVTLEELESYLRQIGQTE